MLKWLALSHRLLGFASRVGEVKNKIFYKVSDMLKKIPNLIPLIL